MSKEYNLMIKFNEEYERFVLSSAQGVIDELHNFNRPLLHWRYEPATVLDYSEIEIHATRVDELGISFDYSFAFKESGDSFDDFLVELKSKFKALEE